MHRPPVSLLRPTAIHARHSAYRAHREGRTFPLHSRPAGIDVHRMLPVVTVLTEKPDGSFDKHCREFGGFEHGCCTLAARLVELKVSLVEN
jgi:hypothetical protein